MAPRRPRDIGTAAESAVVRYLRGHGWPSAERRALRGHHDAGDITGTPGICWSVKGGDAARFAADGQVEKWLAEVDTQCANAGADVRLLVTQRAGIGPTNVRRWWAIMPGWQYEVLTDPRTDRRWHYGYRGPLRMYLSHACAVLRHAGYGTPEETP